MNVTLTGVGGREAWLWLGGSLLVAVLWTNLAWLFSPWVEGEGSAERSKSLAERIVYRLAHWRFAPSLFQGLQLLYYVGLPAAALFWGRDAVVGRLLGLQQLVLPSPAGVGGSVDLQANWSDWLHDLGWAGMLGVGAGLLLLLAALAQRQALSGVQKNSRGRRVSAGRAAREAAYHEIHWAFYRNAPIVTLGLYWGTYAGLALVALEAMVNPMWRRKLRKPGQAWTELLRGGLSVVSSMLFLRTQNLWLAVLVHWAMSWTLKAAYRSPSPVPSDVLSSRQ